jgi:hypothetical protein
MASVTDSCVPETRADGEHPLEETIMSSEAPNALGSGADRNRLDRALSPELGPRGYVGCAVTLVAIAATAAITLGIRGQDSNGAGEAHAPPPSQSITSGPPNAAVPPTTPASRRTLPRGPAVDAAAWIVEQLPKQARIVADPTVGATLAAHFANVRTTTALANETAARVTASTDYVVSTPSLRAGMGPNSAVASLLMSSVPIAIFGRGADNAVVRQVSSASVAQVKAQRALDLDRRRSSERQLLTNPAVRTSARAHPLLTRGALDLHAATVLALMASAGRIEIVDIVAVPAEAAAGLPARIADIRTSSAAAWAVLDALPPNYRLASNHVRPDRSHRLVWRLSAGIPPVGK